PAMSSWWLRVPAWRAGARFTARGSTARSRGPTRTTRRAGTGPRSEDRGARLDHGGRAGWPAPRVVPHSQTRLRPRPELLPVHNRMVTGTLYLVGTPIGNLQDLTDRARATLARGDVLAPEDTRRTGLLLRGIGARPRLISLFEANQRQRVPEILELLREGEGVALVSDAGMPTVSDPGYRLVAACAESGLAIDVVPGPSAGVAALAISGLPTDRFVFEGFLPRTGTARAERLAGLAEEPR